METRVSYVLAGLFVLVLGATLIGLVMWLVAGGNNKVFEAYEVHVSESVAGLNRKAAVRYRGVDVGNVDDIRLDPSDPRKVRLTLKIEQGTPIREDTFATLSTQGLTGLATVELSGGSPQSPMLQSKADQPYPVIQSAPSLVKRLDDAFTDAVIEFDRLSGSIERLLNPENIDAIGTLLVSLSTLSQGLAARGDRIASILDNVDRISGALAGESGTMRDALAAAAATLTNTAAASGELPLLLGQLADAATAARAMAANISTTSGKFDQAVVASRADLRRLVQRTAPELNATLAELNRLSDSVQRFVNELERNPQMLLLGKPAPVAGPGE